MKFRNSIAQQLLKKELIIVSLLCVGLGVYAYFYEDYSQKYWLKLEAENRFENFSKKREINYSLKLFNPNDFRLQDWVNIGFTAKQSQTIINFKERYCKGVISSKEQFKTCYAISDKRFAELEPYLILPEKTQKLQLMKWEKTPKQLQVYQAFNPNDFTIEDWQTIGLSQKQALGMLKYRAFLGGEFHSKQEMAKAYMLKGKFYNQISGYILLPEIAETPIGNHFIASKKYSLQNFNPNDFQKEDWMNIGFSEKQALGILNYKLKICKGVFRNLEELKACYMIKDRFEELKKFIILDEKKELSLVEKKSIDAQLWELNSVTFQQLMDYGFDQHSAAGILAFRKSLGGFQSKIQLKETPYVNTQLAEKLSKEIRLDKALSNQFSLLDVDENVLKKHPYFRYYADKILFFRQTFTTNDKILKALKLPMEDKVKMYWYLKY